MRYVYIFIFFLLVSTAYAQRGSWPSNNATPITKHSILNVQPPLQIQSDGTSNNVNIVADSIDAGDLAATLTMGATDILTFAANDSTTGALIIPQVASACAGATLDGEICWDTVADILYVGDAVGAPTPINSGGGTHPIALGDYAALSIETGDIATDTILAGNIAANAVGTSEVADGTITTTDLNTTLTFGATDLIDFSASTALTGDGIILPQIGSACASTIDDGSICWDNVGKALYIGDGAGAPTPIGAGLTTVDLTADVGATILPVANGGTGVATLTDGGILLGSGTGTVTALGAATNGQIPIGDGTTDPVLGTITGTADEITVTNGTGTITLAIPDTPILTTPVIGVATGTSLVLTGQLTGAVEVTTDSGAGPFTLTDADTKGAWKFYTNAGAVTINLPEITDDTDLGMSVCIYDNEATAILTVNPTATDSIQLDGVDGTDAVDIDSAGAIGDFACFIASGRTTTAGVWTVLGKSGTWVVGT